MIHVVNISIVLLFIFFVSEINICYCLGGSDNSNRSTQRQAICEINEKAAKGYRRDEETSSEAA